MQLVLNMMARLMKRELDMEKVGSCTLMARSMTGNGRMDLEMVSESSFTKMVQYTEEIGNKIITMGRES